MRKLLKFAFWAAVVVAVAYGLASYFLLDFVEIRNNDMAPTLANGDTFVVYRHGDPIVGDVVVCEHPLEAGTKFAGRVVATAGDTVEIQRGGLLLNGRAVQTDSPTPNRFRMPDPSTGRDIELVRVREFRGDDAWIVSVQQTKRPLEMRPRRVQSGIFLLADNRSHGVDSRQLGEIDPATCSGAALMVVSTGTGNGDLDGWASERRFSPVHY